MANYYSLGFEYYFVYNMLLFARQDTHYYFKKRITSAYKLLVNKILTITIVDITYTI